MRYPLLAGGLMLTGAGALAPLLGPLYAALRWQMTLIAPRVTSGGIGSVSGPGMEPVVMALLISGCALAPHAVAQRIARWGKADMSRWFRRHLVLAALTIVVAFVVPLIVPALDYGVLLHTPPDQYDRVFERWSRWQRILSAVSSGFLIAQAACIVGTVASGLKTFRLSAPRAE